jgi:hypothetical protein
MRFVELFIEGVVSAAMGFIGMCQFRLWWRVSAFYKD